MYIFSHLRNLLKWSDKYCHDSRMTVLSMYLSLDKFAALVTFRDFYFSSSEQWFILVSWSKCGTDSR